MYVIVIIIMIKIVDKKYVMCVLLNKRWNIFVFFLFIFGRNNVC